MKDSPSYKQGQKDCAELLKQFSLWYCYRTTHNLGFSRKSKTVSPIKIYRYCEGWCDCLDKAANKHKVSTKQSNWTTNEWCEVVGK